MECLASWDDQLTATSPPVFPIFLTSAEEAPAFDLAASGVALKELAVVTHHKVDEIDPRSGGRGVRRFVLLLQARQFAEARQRVSMRASVFTAQGARCAACGLPFSKERRASSQLDDESQLLCATCFRARRKQRKMPGA